MNKKVVIVVVVVIIGLVIVFVLGGSKKNELKILENLNNIIKIIYNLGEIDVKLNFKKVVVFDYLVLDIMDVLGVVENLVGFLKVSLLVFLEKYKDDKYVDLGGLKELDLEGIKLVNLDLIIINGR